MFYDYCFINWVIDVTSEAEGLVFFFFVVAS